MLDPLATVETVPWRAYPSWGQFAWLYFMSLLVCAAALRDGPRTASPPATPFVPYFVGLGVIEPALRIKQLPAAAAKSWKQG